MNPVIIVAIIVQMVISRASAIAGAVFGYLITIGIFIWGMSVYADGDYIAFFGTRMDQSVFFIFILFWLGYDTYELVKARKLVALASDALAEGGKVLMSTLKDVETAVGKKAFSAKNHNYIGKITAVNSNTATCSIKSDLGKEFSESFNNLEIIGEAVPQFAEYKKANVLPKEIDCPVCGTRLALDENERNEKQFRCPKCNEVSYIN